MFEEMIQLIENHQSYGLAMKQAAESQAQLILNYHTHGTPSGYCVAIMKQGDGPTSIMRTVAAPAELVHIKGVGESERQCQLLMSTLGRELTAHYRLEHVPNIYLNGKPAPASE